MLEQASKIDDVIKDYCRVEQTRVGHILDAQDYLGSWHLSIIIDEKNHLKSSERLIHFLPFTNNKREERFADEDSNKIAPAFHHSGIPSDIDRDLASLREYL